MNKEQANEIIEEALDKITDDKMHAYEEDVLRAYNVSDDFMKKESLRQEIKGQRILTRWEKKVKADEKDLEKQRKMAEKKDREERAKEITRQAKEVADEEDKPVFKGKPSNMKIAEKLYSYYTNGGVSPVVDSLTNKVDGAFVYNPEKAIYEKVLKEEIETQYGRWNGAPILTTTQDGEPKTEKLQINSTDQVRKMFINRAVAETKDRFGTERFFNNAPKGVMFLDCFLECDPSDKETPLRLKERDKTQRARYHYDFEFPEKSFEDIAPIFTEAVYGETSWFSEDEDQEDKIKLLQEFAGASLMGIATHLEKALILIGGGGSGKSAALKLVQSLFPPDSVIQKSPIALSDDYGAVEIDGKLLNACSEMPETKIMDSENIKALITGDPMTVKKKYQGDVKIHPKAGHIYAGNTLPAVRDKSSGFWRRFALLEFNKQYTGSISEKGEHNQERERDIVEKILQNGEKPGVVIWAVRGARRVIENGGYTTPESSMRRLTEWKSGNDPVDRFIKEWCVDMREEPVSEWSAIGDLYQIYKKWAHQNNRSRYAKNNFAQHLDRLGFDSKRKMVDGERRRWRPLAVNTEESGKFTNIKRVK